MARPAPKVFNASSPASVTGALRVPFNTSIRVLTPMRCFARYTALSAICAATVPSDHEGGSLHTSQLPQSSARSSPK